VRRTIAAIGRALVTIGLLILLFVTYTLWGTGIFTARAQAQLKRDFQKELQAAQQENPDIVTTPTTKPRTGGKPPRTTTSTIPARLLVPSDEGEPEGIITIPKIGVEKVFVEGVQLTDLAKGPGHYPGTPLPGQIGNAAIAGHRTTHGAPFYNVNELAPGDKIIVQTLAGKYTYVVYRQPFAVKPTAYYVVSNTKDAQLTLTSCNPRYSAAERIVIKAKLLRKESSKPVKPPTHINGKRIKAPRADQLSTALQGQANSITPSMLMGIVVAVVGLLWWWAFRRWRHPLTWAVGVVPFLIVLFPFFVYLERALPNGY
jgi:sortase A